MATFTRAHYTIAELMRWWDRDELVPQPKFQRRLAWSPDARSYLIDTVMRQLPMPKFFLRRIISGTTKRSAYEVVDGQQRLQAIRDFYLGTLTLYRKHNQDFGDTTFDELSPAAQRIFLQYELTVEVMEKASDPEVWALFDRLNSYTLVLNKQEKLNAKWFGAFKQTAYSLAAEEASLRAWKRLALFTDMQVARMKEVEFTSDVLVAVMHGISDITAIARAYKDYDGGFPRRRPTEQAFRNALAFSTNHLSEAFRKTKFRNQVWAYSMLVALVDAQRGIPEGDGPAELQPPEEIVERMLDVHEILRHREVPRGLSQLKGALSRGTSHQRERKTRHSLLFPLVTYSSDRWRRNWNRLTT